MDDITAITAARGSEYGDFFDHARTSQAIKAAITKGLSDNQKFALLSPDEQNVVREGLGMIAHKIGRIVNGNPRNADSWDDIGGYALITRKRVEANHE